MALGSYQNLDNAIANTEKAIRKAKRGKVTKEIKEELKEVSQQLYLETRRIHEYTGMYFIKKVKRYEKIMKLLEKAGKAAKNRALQNKNKLRIKSILQDLKKNRDIFENLSDKYKKYLKK